MITEQKLSDVIQTKLLGFGCKLLADGEADTNKFTKGLMLIIKSACYLKAERELPETYDDWGGESAKAMAEHMLKEVNGVAYRACKEFED